MEHYRYYPGNMSGDASGDMLYAKYGYLDYSYNNGSPYYFNESVSKEDKESTNTEDKQGNRSTFVIIGCLIIICAMILILEFLKDFYL